MALSVDSAFDYLSSAVSAGRLASAYLIAGPAGSGKEQLVSRLVSLVNGVPCTDRLDGMLSDNLRLLRPALLSLRTLLATLLHLRLLRLQREGRNVLEAAAFLRGLPLPPGTQFADNSA